MVAYRFCRPDDNPTLARAVNECFDVHFPESPPLTLERFQREIRELDVWPSNSMIATEGGTPVSVSIATKRPEEVLVLRIGTHPDFLRRGHAAHLLNSLGQKLGVLGPERLISEVPRQAGGACRLFENAGFVCEAGLFDWELAELPEPLGKFDLLIPVTVEDLTGSGIRLETPGACWERQARSLENRRERLKGWALAAADRLEGCCLYEVGDVRLRIMHLQSAFTERAEVWLRLLIRALSGEGKPLLIPRVRETEPLAFCLPRLGFQRSTPYNLYSRTIDVSEN